MPQQHLTGLRVRAYVTYQINSIHRQRLETSEYSEHFHAVQASNALEFIFGLESKLPRTISSKQISGIRGNMNKSFTSCSVPLLALSRRNPVHDKTKVTRFLLRTRATAFFPDGGKRPLAAAGSVQLLADATNPNVKLVIAFSSCEM